MKKMLLVVGLGLCFANSEAVNARVDRRPPQKQPIVAQHEKTIIEVQVDHDCELELRENLAQWRNNQWGLPSNTKIGGVLWNPKFSKDYDKAQSELADVIYPKLPKKKLRAVFLNAESEVPHEGSVQVTSPAPGTIKIKFLDPAKGSHNFKVVVGWEVID